MISEWNASVDNCPWGPYGERGTLAGRQVLRDAQFQWIACVTEMSRIRNNTIRHVRNAE